MDDCIYAIRTRRTIDYYGIIAKLPRMLSMTGAISDTAADQKVKILSSRRIVSGLRLKKGTYIHTNYLLKRLLISWANQGFAMYWNSGPALAQRSCRLSDY